MSTRPLVCALMRSIASLARTLSGCVVGTLLAYLRENSGAARATHGMATVAPAAAPANRTLRRVLKIVIMVPPTYADPGHHGQGAGTRQGSMRSEGDGDGESKI